MERAFFSICRMLWGTRLHFLAAKLLIRCIGAEDSKTTQTLLPPWWTYASISLNSNFAQPRRLQLWELLQHANKARDLLRTFGYMKERKRLQGSCLRWQLWNLSFLHAQVASFKEINISKTYIFPQNIFTWLLTPAVFLEPFPKLLWHHVTCRVLVQVQTTGTSPWEGRTVILFYYFGQLCLLGHALPDWYYVLKMGNTKWTFNANPLSATSYHSGKALPWNDVPYFTGLEAAYLSSRRTASLESNFVSMKA